MIEDIKPESPDDTIPVVLIGHSKSSYFNDSLHLLFDKLKSNKDIKFQTMREFVMDRV